MIITKTPVRISLLGGGTDYPEYFKHWKGSIIGTTIDKYIYVAVNKLVPVFDYKIRVNYSQIELIQTCDKIQHPSARECLQFVGVESDIEIHHMSDIPTCSGLGSSSAFTVGLLNALYAYLSKKVSKQQLAEDAINVERNIIGERVGCQDQYHAVFGGFNHIVFNRNGIQVYPLQVPPEKLADIESSTMIFLVDLKRYSNDILKEQIERTKKGSNDRHLADLCALTEEAQKILLGGGDIIALGKLIHEGWLLKKQLSTAVTNGIIDQAYEVARSKGAIGGKLSGAGRGGFFILIVPKECQDQVRDALCGLKEMPFRFEKNGSEIIYCQPEEQIRNFL